MHGEVVWGHAPWMARGKGGPSQSWRSNSDALSLPTCIAPFACLLQREQYEQMRRPADARLPSPHLQASAPATQALTTASQAPSPIAPPAHAHPFASPTTSTHHSPACPGDPRAQSISQPLPVPQPFTRPPPAITQPQPQSQPLAFSRTALTLTLSITLPISQPLCGATLVCPLTKFRPPLPKPLTTALGAPAGASARSRAGSRAGSPCP